MTVLLWPSTLPQAPQKGFSESVGVNVIRSSTDKGPAKQRRRGTRPSTMSVTFIVTTAQAAILENFLNNDLEGVRRFLFPHPRLSVLATQNTWKEVRIVPQGDGEFFKLQYIAPGYWSTDLNLEILP